MTRPLFLAALDGAAVGGEVVIAGDEAHHAVAVKRIVPGEPVLVSDGRGTAITGVVTGVTKRECVVLVDSFVTSEAQPLTWTVVQALAKGERSDIAVQTATELGARRILAWQAARSIVRWQGDRTARSLEKWRSTAREATKQSRRFHVPDVGFATTGDVVSEIRQADVTLILHEDAEEHIAQLDLPQSGIGQLIVGPEGGISPDELDSFRAAGAVPVRISDGVLRTSTAAAVALGQLDVLARRR